jgi:hypothetical protein
VNAAGIAGGPIGDNAVTAGDVAAILQFQARLAFPTAGQGAANQFQRSDVNNNGGIDIGDVQIIRQYVLNSINGGPASGPTAPAAATPTPAPRAEDEGARTEAVGRTIRTVNTVGVAGQQVTVPVQLDSQGDEGGLSFTVNFNPAILTFVSFANGNGLPPNTTVITNSTQTAQGRLGVVISNNTTPFAAGTRQLMLITFLVNANAPSSTVTPLPINSSLVPLEAATVLGAPLPITPETGNVILTPTAAGVTVSGRVTSASGQGIRNATVVLTDAAGNRRTATTGSFGFYSFEGVEAGATYVVGVTSKRFRFTPRTISVADSLADVDFVGQE